MKRSSVTDLPRLAKNGFLTSNSLKKGHVQRSTSPHVNIFFEDGQYHVTGIVVTVALLGERGNTKSPQVMDYQGTVHVDTLYDAHRLMLSHARKYPYRTKDSIVPREAIPAGS